MAYTRRDVTDGVTVMNADLYNNVQDGIDESKNSIADLIVAVNNGKIGYDAERHYLTIGSISESSGGNSGSSVIDEDNDGEFEENDIVTQQDASDIFDEAEANNN